MAVIIDADLKSMKPVYVILFAAAGFLLLVGTISLVSGLSHPVYTDPDAPAKLSESLKNLPREERFEKWYQLRPTIETPHKTRADFGRGIIALALGTFLATLLLQLLPKVGSKFVGFTVWSYWIALWAIKFPLTIRYYALRQSRFDYPVWGDSVAIGIAEDFFVWGVGFVIFSSFLAMLMFNRRMPKAINLRTQKGAWSRIRTVILWLWIALLLTCIFPAIPDGDEGMVLSCTAAIPVILLALSATSRHDPLCEALFPPRQPKIVDDLRKKPPNLMQKRSFSIRRPRTLWVKSQTPSATARGEFTR